MATKQTRGTKRTCQNDDCDMKFYDLNRDPIVCPDCATVYRLAVVPEEEEIPAVVAAAPVAAPAAAAVDGDEVSDDDDALVSLEDADAELGATDATTMMTTTIIPFWPATMMTNLVSGILSAALKLKMKKAEADNAGRALYLS